LTNAPGAKARAGSVLVVGGGMVGMASAFYLRREGFDVTLIDQGRLGGACSSGNCGLVCPGHVLPLTLPGAMRTALASLFDPGAPFRVRPQLRLSLYRWFFEFARRCSVASALDAGAKLKTILDASAEEYRQLFRAAIVAAEYQATGALYLFRTAAGLAHFAEDHVRPLEDFGVRIRPVSAEDIVGRYPGILSGATGAFHFEDDAFVRPGALCASMAETLRGDGVTVLEDTAVTGATRAGTRITSLVTATGSLVADQYVIATGAWSRPFGARLGVELPVEPGKGYSLILERPDPCLGLPVLMPETRIVATPFRTGLRLGSMMEFAGYDTSLSAVRLRQLIDRTAAYIELPRSRDFTDGWFGWRPMTWDSLPIIGRPRRTANAIVATGHNMLGITLAPATGRLVADLAMERPTFIDARAYSPDRF
jgi:D-amino-acid dehydrogenase